MLITIPITPVLSPDLGLLAVEAETWALNLLPSPQQGAWTNLAAALRSATPEASSLSFEAPLTVFPNQENDEFSNNRLNTMRVQAGSRGSETTRKAWQEIANVLGNLIIRGRIEGADVFFVANFIRAEAVNDIDFAMSLALDPEALAAAKVLAERIHEWEKERGK